MKVLRSIVGALCGIVVWAYGGDAQAEGSNGQGGAAGERHDWPCQGCIFVTPPGYDAGTPAPLLVTFHGDEGDPDYIHWSWEGHAAAAGWMILSLECPRDVGCDTTQGSWWMWEGTEFHDPLWAGVQVDAVEAEYNVELQQVYLAGFSGGSSYISNYGPLNSERFAGLVYLGGGFPPWNGECRAACSIPAYFLIGSNDFLLDGATDLNAHLSMCGHETIFDEVPGVDHTIIENRLPEVVAFLAERPHLCREEPTPPDTGGEETDGEAGSSSGGGDPSDTDAPPEDEDEDNPPEDETEDDADESTVGSGTNPFAEPQAAEEGCGCRNGTAPASWLMLLGLFGLRRRRTARTGP